MKYRFGGRSSRGQKSTEVMVTEAVDEQCDGANEEGVGMWV